MFAVKAGSYPTGTPFICSPYVRPYSQTSEQVGTNTLAYRPIEGKRIAGLAPGVCTIKPFYGHNLRIFVIS